MVLVYAVLATAILGSLILMLPIANAEGGFTDPRDAFFTAVSAVTVTGLVTVDTGSAWSGFGKAVILFLIFVSGLGFMTGAAFLILITGQRVGLSNRLIIRESIASRHLGGVTVQVRRIFAVAIVTQAIGAVILFLDFLTFAPLWEGIRWHEALWHALFHSVSAFNNAGFEILPDEKVGVGFSGLRSNFFSLGIFASLILAGSLSVSVLSDVWNRRNFSTLTLDSKLVLLGTLGLILLGAGVYLATDWNSLVAPTDRPISEKAIGAFFESISSRTAGFTTVDQEASSNARTIFTQFLMFIGGASASVAGGIKISTFMVIVLAILSALRGERSVQIFRRRIPTPNVRRALSIGALGVLVIIFFMMLLTIVQPDLSFEAAFFEVVSAFGTCGLSQNTTSELNNGGSVIVIILMLLGRLGPLSIALLMVGRETHKTYKPAEERVRIG